MRPRAILDHRTRRTLGGVALTLACCRTAGGQELARLWSAPALEALAAELSGESAKRHVDFFSGLHRMRGSRPLGAAGRYVVERLGQYGVADARLESLPADGQVFYGTQRSRAPWDAEFAELWELRPTPAGDQRAERLASFEAVPLSLAQDSESGEATAELVDVGPGTRPQDYAGKDVQGRFVLVSTQPSAVQALACERFGAAGIVSDAQNQRTAWWGEDRTLVRWGHLDSFPRRPTFAFMISPARGQALRERLARGESVRLEARVRAGRRPGAYEIASASIPGRSPEEIVLSCHLDHPRPGANDNASGCAAILEVARALQALLASGRLPRPELSLRFVWPPEIEGTQALLSARPEWAARVKAAIHLDMVGGGAETKAVFHVTRGPASRPSVVNDVAEALAEFVNAQTYSLAASGEARFPLTAPEGGREPLRAELSEFTAGSDHQVYAEASWGVPVAYFNDWPDRYIHTTRDLPAHIDPTKLKRAAFLAAALGYTLATLDAPRVPALLDVVEARALQRAAQLLRRRALLEPAERDGLTRFALAFERSLVDSIERFVPLGAADRRRAEGFLAALAALVGRPAPAPVPAGAGAAVWRRAPEPRGPMSGFGYDYFIDRYGAERAAALALPHRSSERCQGGEHAYEALNFVDGRRTLAEIHAALAAVCGPLPAQEVGDYLRALESIGVLVRVR